MPDVDGGWSTAGVVGGVSVEALAAPVVGRIGVPRVRAGGVTTAGHAVLLRGLVDWDAALPELARTLVVCEDLEGSGQLAGRLVLARGSDVSQVAGLVTSVPDDGWSELRGMGVLPTGHGLTISVPR